MGDSETKRERFRGCFETSWVVLAVVSLIALALGLSQVAVETLAQTRDVTTCEPKASCSYKLAADEIRGAGEGALRQFNVLPSGGKIEAVQFASSATEWDRFQERFKNSWIGIAILAAVSLVGAVCTMLVGLNQLGFPVKDRIERAWPKLEPAADILIQDVVIKPIDEKRHLAEPASAQTILPGGAIVSFDARHNAKGDEAISINGLDVRVTAYETNVPCPHQPTGDGIRGAGTGAPRVFQVWLAGGKVDAVQLTQERGAPPMHGRSDDLLALDPPFWLVLRKGEDPEKIVVRFVAVDYGLYRLDLSMRYSNNKRSETVKIASVAFCKPRKG
jgi:hypothetical protein